MTYPEMTASGHAGRRRRSPAGSLLLGALMIAIPALAVAPSAAQDKGKQIQQRQSSRVQERRATPARKSSPSPKRQATSPRSSKTSRRSGDSGSRSKGTRSGSSSRSSDKIQRHVVRDTHPGTSSRRSSPRTRDASPRTRTRDANPGNDWRVTARTPVPEADSGHRYRHRDDRRYGANYERHRGDRDGHRYHDRRGKYYGHKYHRHHRHHRYCGHVWGGYYDYWSWGRYRYRGYYPWYWPWWPTVYIETDRYSADDGWGALDLDVRPERAEIYLDGQYVGIADEYDGFPRYLWLEKGTYDVAIYLEGYETIFRQISIYPGIVIDVEDRMRAGQSIHPDDHGPTSTARRDARIERNREKEEAARAAEAREVWSTDSPAAAADANVGRLFISVLPPDSAVYLDGHFLGTAAEVGQLSAGLVVEPGDHVIELVRPGYETYRKEIVVPPGERTNLEIELERD